MRLRNLLAAGVLGALSCCDAAATQTRPARWNASKSSHFELFHQAKKLPSGISIGMEKIHSRLRLQMDLLAPWIKKNKLKTYVYADKQSYVSGEFHPPSWSQGISFYASKTIVLHQSPSKDAFFETAAHEITHLLLTSFFKEKNKEAPFWLEEGLATLMEELAWPDAQRPQWAGRAMVKKSWQPAPLAEFFGLPVPQKESSSRQANDWYLQSYALTKYLFLAYGKLRLKVFCDNLRSGDSLEKSLWKAYRIRSIENLEGNWLAWLKSQRKAVR